MAGRKKFFYRRKVCNFCVDKSTSVDYKEYGMLRRFTTDRGRIIPRRITGNCAKHQRMLTAAIKKARVIALLPFSAKDF
jgi:small subunit ribosomal protein S18